MVCLRDEPQSPWLSTEMTRRCRQASDVIVHSLSYVIPSLPHTWPTITANKSLCLPTEGWPGWVGLGSWFTWPTTTVNRSLNCHELASQQLATGKAESVTMKHCEDCYCQSMSWCLLVFLTVCLVRRRRLLQAKATSYILVVVLCFLLTRLLSNVWTDFHQIFTKRRLCGVIR